MGKFEEEWEQMFRLIEQSMAARIGYPEGIQTLVGKSFVFKPVLSSPGAQDLRAQDLEVLDIGGRITGAAFRRFSDFAEYVQIELTLDVGGLTSAEGDDASRLVYYARLGQGRWCYFGKASPDGLHGTLVIL